LARFFYLVGCKFGQFLDSFGRLFGQLWAIFGQLWAIFGQFWATFCLVTLAVSDTRVKEVRAATGKKFEENLAWKPIPVDFDFEWDGLFYELRDEAS
jgi:hypothetical protein